MVTSHRAHYRASEICKAAPPRETQRTSSDHRYLLLGMRIRKHFHLSSLLSAAGDFPRPPSRICGLNQSPWDVFDSPPSSPPQLDRDESFAAAAHGGTSVNSVAATHSVTNTKMFEHGEANYFKSELSSSSSSSEEERVMCAKSDGKKWRCKSVAAKGNLLCEHHLELLKNYQSLAQSSNRSSKKKKMKKEEVEVAAPVSKSSRRVRARKTPESTNPYEFYYYSGFGPSWGKKRGAKKKDELVLAEEEEVFAEEDSHSSPFSSEVHEIDTEDDEEEEEESGAIRKRRGRKPIKARSLKSLM